MFLKLRVPFKEELVKLLKRLFSNYDLSPFISAEYNPIERYTLLASAAEYVFSSLEKLNIESSGKIRGGIVLKHIFLKTDMYPKFWTHIYLV